MNSTRNYDLTLDQEHDQLEQEVLEWRRWWAELREMGEPHFGEMGDRLRHFRDRLSQHFQHEEFRGPLAGRTDPDTARVWREHAQLIGQLDHLVDRLHRCGPDVGCWGGARRDFEEFLDRLHAHEANESRLIADE